MGVRTRRLDDVSAPVNLIVFCLSGELPKPPVDSAITDRVVHLTGPSLKRERDSGQEAESTAKRLKTATLLCGGVQEANQAKLLSISLASTKKTMMLTE